MPSAPTVTVLVLNYNGEHHLRQCLPTLEALDYPGARITVVDNGSSDGSLELVRAQHPCVNVFRLPTNRGFSVAYNAAVADAETDFVALLNNDTRVASTWLSALVDTAERHRAAAAASTILDWDGSRIDFVGGLPMFAGHSWQLDYGAPVGKAYPERQLLFPCGGSTLVRRDAFLEAGGFDEDYFAYFEDVDLGWRMTLLGHKTIFAPKAITYHRMHGTATRWAHVLRLRLYERNALATIFKNYDDAALARTLAPAVAMTLARNLSMARLDGSAVQFGNSVPSTADVPAPLIGSLIAIEDFSRMLPALADKRRRVQASRRVADEEILPLFPTPLRLHDVDDTYRAAAEALIRDFRVAELFGLKPPLRSVTVPASANTPVAHGSQSPRVSIIVLTASGARHLPECLDSLREHTWPAEDTEVIVVDNGSVEDPTRIAKRHYPRVRVTRAGRNLGFAAGNNAGARLATGDWLVFLNDDTRVGPRWLDELMAVARRRNAASVGALITDWTGERVDFAGGLVNFEGRGYSLGHGLPLSQFAPKESPLLFGCGAAVLFRRDIFEETGGWDEATFAYYEDVEFGWRLWLLGHEVWLAPDARVYHKHHGTSGSESPARTRALERNALRMIYTHLEESTLQRVLPAALLFAADRALLGTAFSRAAGESADAVRKKMPGRLRPGAVKIRLLHALSRRGARRQMGTWWNLRRVGARGLVASIVDVIVEMKLGWHEPTSRSQYQIERVKPSAALDGRVERVPVGVFAALLGIRDFLESLSQLSARRAWLQARRRRSDAEIVSRFGANWLSGVPSAHVETHLALRNQVATLLGIDTPLEQEETI
jgi:GT2 family glycosyltransferase